jgi:ubiquinol-cytochrome c reductase cytochrome b subunit
LGIFYFLPLRVNRVKATRISAVRKRLFWWFVRVCFILTWIGGNPVEEPYVLIGQITSGVYYLYFLVLIMY